MVPNVVKLKSTFYVLCVFTNTLIVEMLHFNSVEHLKSIYYNPYTEVNLYNSFLSSRSSQSCNLKYYP